MKDFESEFQSFIAHPILSSFLFSVDSVSSVANFRGSRSQVAPVTIDRSRAGGSCWRGSQAFNPILPKMSRIFLTLASLSLLLVITALSLGLTMGELDPQAQPTPETLHWATFHRLTGVAAALSVVFVECIVVTYFIGTSRWCKEVVETYQLDRSAVPESNRLKRRTFPWALLGMLTVVGIVALGGAADPGATVQLNTRTWAYWHLLGAMAGIVLVMWTYLVAWSNILANHAIIERVMDEVAQIRERRGLTAAEEVRS